MNEKEMIEKEMIEKEINEKYFLKIECVKKIKILHNFYKNNYQFHNNNYNETKKWQDAINECLKKKCPIGMYNLYGKCVYG